MKLRLVAVLLLVVEPLSFAGEALRVLPTLQYRGIAAMLELILHGAVAATAAAGGMALWHGAPAGRRIARIAVLGVAFRIVQSQYWSILPSNTMPGHAAANAAVALCAAGVALWLIRDANREDGQA